MTEEESRESLKVKVPESLPEKTEEKALEKPGIKEQADVSIGKKAEQAPEDALEISEVGESLGEVPGDNQAPAPVAGDMSHEERKQLVEAIMSDGLEDEFLKMPPDKQAEFKQAGEETAGKINELLEKARVKVKKIVDLLKKWLSIIPGANKFFIEQEAKIRADRIAKMKYE